MTIATAHPNIALVKYWGKQTRPGNYPATANLSITLSELTTTTAITNHTHNELWLNGERAQDSKILQFLDLLRASYTLPPLKITTDNNFPTGAGLASSASGFAALITAINQHADLAMTDEQRSDWARQGSASAARSIFAGFVGLAPPNWQATPIADAEHWPLVTVIAVTNEAKKAVSSTQGMEQSRLTSPYYDAWVETSLQDYDAGLRAIQNKDIDQLAQVAERSCLKMHSVMMTSTPSLAYWNPGTIACMDAVRTLRDQGTPVFFTIDAGPQVKAICEPTHAATVAQTLGALPGVTRTFTCGMGDGAKIVDATSEAEAT